MRSRGHHPGEGGGHAYQEGHDAGQLDGGDQDTGHVVDLQLSVEEEGKQGGVHHSHDGALGWGKGADADAAQHDHGHHEGRDGLDERLAYPTASRPGLHGQVHVAGYQVHGDHHAQPHQPRRSEAREEEEADGHVGGDAVDDHCDGRRDQDGKSTRGRDHGGCQAPGVPSLAI